jgi:hypothetical protein
MVFITHNCLFRLGVLTNTDVEYTKEERLDFLKSELPVHAIKRLNNTKINLEAYSEQYL